MSNETKYTDSEVMEFAAYYSLLSKDDTDFTLFRHFENWKQSKSIPNKQDDRIEVKHLGIHAHFYLGVDTGYYQFQLSKPISGNKFPEIKQAIEAVLCEDDCAIKVRKDYWKQLNDDLKFLEAELDANQDKIYTKSEVDTIREETWNESRKLTTGTSITGFLGTGLKYPTLQDYLKSLSENKSTQPSEDKPVLFITEDGVEYRVGEKKEIWGVHTKDGYNAVGAYHPDVHPEYYESLKAHYEHFFSTKEAAEQYILDNKPCLSFNEVNYLIWLSSNGFNDSCTPSKLRESILHKIKQKLKQ